MDVNTNRRFATTVKKLLLELNSIIDRKNVLTDNESSFKIILAFLRNSIYEYIFPIEEFSDIKDIVFDEVDEKDIEKFSRIHDPEIRDLHLKIINDRRRLRSLLELLRSPKVEENNLKDLEEAIIKRKAKFHYEDIEEEIDLPKSSINREYRKKRFKKITAIILSLISATLLLFFSIRFGQDYYREYRVKEKLLLEKKKREGLITRYNIHVSDKDIFTYANQVAKRNGYRRITITRLKEKNPNWIYPGNNFTMLDGEIVTVVKGDTLWGLSHRKIMRLNLEFYETVDRIKEGIKPGRDVEKDIEILKKLAFTEKHYKMIHSIEKRE